MIEGGLVKKEDIEKDSSQVLSFAQQLAIPDSNGFIMSEEFRIRLKKKISDIKEFCEPNISRLCDVHRAALADMNALLKPYIDADKIVEQKRIAFLQEDKIKRIERERIAQDLAQKQAEDVALALAQAEASRGNYEKADNIIANPIKAGPICLKTDAPLSKGIFLKKRHKWRMVNESLIPNEYKKLVVDKEKISGTIKSLGTLANIPGVEVYIIKKEIIRKR